MYFNAGRHKQGKVKERVSKEKGFTGFLNTTCNTNLCYIYFNSESRQLVITLKGWKIDSCLGNGWNKHGENEMLKELLNKNITQNHSRQYHCFSPAAGDSATKKNIDS